MIKFFNGKDISNLNLEQYKSSDGYFHYFYKVEQINGELYYYGVHSTKNIYDKYKGSGYELNRTYKKYGDEKFKMTIELFFSNREELFKHENSIVNIDLLYDKNCLNLTVGGYGNKTGMIPVVYIANNKKLYITVDEYYKNKDMYRFTSKGRIHINNGVKNKMIYQSELQNYPDWKIGQINNATTGKIAIRKDDMMQYIYPSELDTYLSQGWVKKGATCPKRTNVFAKNKIWVTNGIVQKRASENELDTYLSQGWKKGTCQKLTTGYIRIVKDNIQKNIDPSELETYLSQGWKKGVLSKTNKNYCWINNTQINKMIMPSELETYLSQGWKKGRLNVVCTTTGKICINLNGIDKMIMPSELETYLSQGWEKGSCKHKNEKMKNYVSINNGIIQRKIDKSELETYLAQGWKKGWLKNKKMAYQTGKIVINNGKEIKFIFPSELETYLAQGWEKGKKLI